MWQVASEEGRSLAPWAGTLVTLVLGAVSGTFVPWAVIILFAVLPEAGAFIEFVAILMPLLACTLTVATFAVLSGRYASKSGTSPFWAVGGGIGGMVFQIFVLAEIIRYIINQD